MDDLISRAAFRKDVQTVLNDTACPLHVAAEIEQYIDLAPAVDAVQVVHGKWVRVHGYATPGGDPVWKCSICGKGKHVYGIEHGSYGADIADGQWVSCPNCGAVMDGEEGGID